MQLKNSRGNIQRKAGTALYNVHESLPGDWQTFSDNNIRLAEQVSFHELYLALAENTIVCLKTRRLSMIITSG